MTKTQQLQKVADQLRTPEQWEFEIVWRGFGGWRAVAAESRYFNDEGEYLGDTVSDAEATLRLLLG